METHSSIHAWKIPWTEDPTVHGVAKSQTRLSDFSSSSSRNIHPWKQVLNYFSPHKPFLLLYFSSVSHVRLFATLWTVACQAPLSMGFSRHEYWSGFPFPSPEDLPDPGIEPGSCALQADSLPSEPPGLNSKLSITILYCHFLVD